MGVEDRMGRPVTLFSGQWADLPLDALAADAKSMGFDGLEIACWGEHLDVARAAAEGDYCPARLDILRRHGLRAWAVSNHLVGQAVCDLVDVRHRGILPPRVWGDGEPEGVRRRAAHEMILTVRAAHRLGLSVVNGFTGSSAWHFVYAFPPVDPALVRAGFDDFARRWGPIFDQCAALGVRFALEVHPTEIAYDIITAEQALSAVGGHRAFGFNFDPSHLLWQGVDPARFIDRFPDRIFHAHMKDVRLRPNGACSILGAHLPFGDPRRSWDFRSVGRGDVDFDAVFRALNRAGYSGPLSVEWEDPDMDRRRGARESCEVVRRLDFEPAGRAFDASFTPSGAPSRARGSTESDQ
jgi:sugar phosphate isomerase/epimerase